MGEYFVEIPARSPVTESAFRTAARAIEICFPSRRAAGQEFRYRIVGRNVTAVQRLLRGIVEKRNDIGYFAVFERGRTTASPCPAGHSGSPVRSDCRPHHDSPATTG